MAVLAHSKRFVARAFLLFSTACSAPGEVCDAFGQSEQAVRYATGDAGTDPAPLVDTLFVVRGADRSPGDPAVSCTASRVSVGWLLTAKHCTRGVHAANLVVAPATTTMDPADPCAAEVEFPVRRIVRHPTLDVALLSFDDEAQGAAVPVASGTPETGESVTIAGFGLTEANQLGELRALPAAVLEVTPDFVVVQGRGGGACVGDSGSPLLSSEEPRVSFGVLSKGSATCLGKDYYVNLETAGEWLARSTAPRGTVD